MSPLTKYLSKFWDTVNGNKTLIGVVALYLDGKYLSSVGGWYVETIRILLYFWTGIGTIHKGVKYGRGKGYLSKIPNIRESIDRFRDRGRQKWSIHK
jgi:hypothetical protein